MRDARRGPEARGLRWRSLDWSCCLAVGSALALAGCSTNLATGRQQVNFFSEAEEIAIGQQADAEITSTIGLMDDPELQAYVADLGSRLASQSERPGLPWSFKLLDDPVVNAFALPGGYVYVTRGILGHMSSEAELASVLGHEIGHVTAQHGVNQLSKQQLAAGGLLVGAVLSPEVARAAGTLQAGLGLLFLKYGRDDETEADDLGLRYLTRNGFDAREMPEMFSVLEGVGRVEGAGRLPSWLSTHPDPAARRARTEEMIARQRLGGGEVGADRFLRTIDGLRFGHDPREGFFEGSTYYHPGLAVQVTFPDGWRALNEKSRVVGMHPERVAQVQMTLAEQPTAKEASDAFLAQDNVTRISSRNTRINGLRAVRTDFSVATARAISGRAAFVEQDGRVYQLLALVYADRAVAAGSAFDQFLGSFKTLKDRNRLAAEPQKIALVELPEPMSFEEFRSRWPSDVDPELLALINRVDDPSRVLPAGTLLKRIEGKRAGAQTARPPQ